MKIKIETITQPARPKPRKDPGPKIGRNLFGQEVAAWLTRRMLTLPADRHQSFIDEMQPIVWSFFDDLDAALAGLDRKAREIEKTLRKPAA